MKFKKVTGTIMHEDDFGIDLVLKRNHRPLRMIMEYFGDTQADAAKQLGISVSWFQQIYWLKKVPNFRSARGKLFADRLYRWSGGLTAEQLFPEAFFTKEFLEEPRKYVRRVSFREMMLMRSKRQQLLIAVDPIPVNKTNNSLPHKKKKRRKRRTGKKK